MAKTGHNLVFSMLKWAPAWKKTAMYTSSQSDNNQYNDKDTAIVMIMTQCRYRLLRLSVWSTHQITAKSSPAATN